MSGNSDELEQLSQQVQYAGEVLSRLNIDTEKLQEQKIDEEVVQWYEKRFNMFIEDGCREAIVAYLKKMKERTDINDVTKIAVGTLTLR